MSPSSQTPLGSFRAPGTQRTLDELLERGWPDADAAARDALVQSRAVIIDGRPARKLTTMVRPGHRVDVRRAPPAIDALGTGVLAGRLLVPSLPWHRGVFARLRGMQHAIAFERREERGGLCELWVRSEEAEPGAPADAFWRDVRRAVARAGHPVLADVGHTGILVAGGLRLVAADAREPDLWWPDEPVRPGDAAGEGLPVLGVSAATRKIVGRGHPWILRDDETDDPERLAPGAHVEVTGPSGYALGTACMEGSGRITARMWSTGAATSVEARVAGALDRRRPLLRLGLDPPVTDAFRLIHGEADRLPGLFVDRLGPLLRVLVTSPGTRSYRGRALDALVHALEPQLGSDPPVVEVLHLRDRPAGEFECTRLVRGSTDALEASGRLRVRERGVVFLVDPGLGRPTRSSPGFGLYLDQRENRARLVQGLPPGGRLLNLFAHTGAFTAAWLAAGDGEAVSVDLSGAYLRWLADNLAVNGIDPARHRVVRQDGRRYLETLAAGERFDAIVLDPPTAAAAGRRFWSVAKELPPLVERALAHLVPGGRLLVSRNDRRRSALEGIVSDAAARVGVPLRDVQPAPPGFDFPLLPGFPEGDPFAALFATRK